MKIEASGINGTGPDRAAVIVQKGERMMDAMGRLSQKVAGKGAFFVWDSGVKGKATFCESTGNVIGEYWVSVDGETVSAADFDFGRYHDLY